MSIGLFLSITTIKDMIYQTLVSLYGNCMGFVFFGILSITVLILGFIAFSVYVILIIIETLIYRIPGPIKSILWFLTKPFRNYIRIKINNYHRLLLDDQLYNICIEGSESLKQLLDKASKRQNQHKNQNVDVSFDENKLVQWNRMKIEKKHPSSGLMTKSKNKNEAKCTVLLSHAVTKFREYLGNLESYNLLSLFKAIYYNLYSKNADDKTPEDFNFIEEHIENSAELRGAVINQLVNERQGKAVLCPRKAINNEPIPINFHPNASASYHRLKEIMIWCKVHHS